MGKFDSSQNDSNSDGYSFNSTKHLKSLIQGHAQWIKRYLDDGWDGYLVTVMFNYLPGKRETKIMQMHQEVTRLYGRLATRMAGKTWSANRARLLPIGIFIPDLPVPKTRKGLKSTIADVSINDGLHMHGIVLGNRLGRIRIGLDKHFDRRIGQYLTSKIRNIDVKPITEKPGYVVGYALKGLVKRSAKNDDVLVLNWGGMRLD